MRLLLLLLLLPLCYAANSTFTSNAVLFIRPMAANSKLELQAGSSLILDLEGGLFYLTVTAYYSSAGFSGMLPTARANGNLGFTEEGEILFSYPSKGGVYCPEVPPPSGGPILCPYLQQLTNGPFVFGSFPATSTTTITSLIIEASTTYVDPLTQLPMNFLGASQPITWACSGSCASLLPYVPAAPLPANVTVTVVNATELITPDNVKYYGAKGDCIADDTGAFQLAINYVSAQGGGVVYIPSGCYSVTAPVSTRVALNEGAAFLLYAGSSNILFKGEYAATTRIVPKSNKVEIFSIAGASNISFVGLAFDNSGNGLLQNQPIPPSNLNGPNAGVAGLGNAANAAISQWLGSGLVVKECIFDTFIRAIWYDGNYTDVSVGVGDFVAARNFFSSCVFCILVAQPYTVTLENNEDRYTTYSFNAVGGPDGGHQLYLTNRGGAVPVSVVVNGATSYYSNASVIKINKGLDVAISDMTCANSYGCFNLQNVAHATITNIVGNAVNRTAVAPNVEAMLAFFACGYVSLTNFVIDTRGTDMIGIELGTGTAPQSFSNLDNSISHGTIIYDALTNIDSYPLLAANQIRLKVSFVKAIRYGAVALRLSPFQARTCTDCEFLRPSHISVDPAANLTSSLISLDSGTTGTYVTFADNDITGPYSRFVTTVGGSLDRNVLTNPVVRLNHGNYLGVYTTLSNGNTSQPAYTFDSFATTGLYATGASGGALCVTANGVATMCHFTNSIRPTVPVWAATYGCVGCTSTPTASSTGDWTATRLWQGANQVIDTISCTGCTSSSKTGGTYSFTIPTPGSGTVTSVTGTTNQVCVATGTTTPVLSICPAFSWSGTSYSLAIAGDYSAISSSGGTSGQTGTTPSNAFLLWTNGAGKTVSANVYDTVVQLTATNGANSGVFQVTPTFCQSSVGISCPFFVSTDTGDKVLSSCTATGPVSCSASGGVLTLSQNLGALPSLSLGSAAGTSPTSVSITGRDISHQIAFNIGTSTTGSSNLFTVTFGTARAITPYVNCVPTSDAAALFDKGIGGSYGWFSSITTTGYTYFNAGSAIAGTPQYKFTCTVTP